jgi:nucleoside-diphosphate-sugar epimerase
MAKSESEARQALPVKRNAASNSNGRKGHEPIQLGAPTRNEEGKIVLKAKQTREQMEDEIINNVQGITGTKDFLAGDRILHQVGNALIYPRAEEKNVILRAASAIAEHAPQNGTQAMLATQMIATHDAVCTFMMRATLKDQTPYGIDSNTDRAARLMRVFMDQVELMQKLKGHTSQQRVTVEHVHVHDGGQAIVGAVAGSRAGRGRGKNHDEQ